VLTFHLALLPFAQFPLLAVGMLSSADALRVTFLHFHGQEIFFKYFGEKLLVAIFNI